MAELNKDPTSALIFAVVGKDLTRFDDYMNLPYGFVFTFLVDSKRKAEYAERHAQVVRERNKPRK